MALVAPIRLEILLKIFWAGWRTPLIYGSVTEYHFFWIALKNVEMSFSATRWYWWVINAINDLSMQSMSNQWLKILWPIDYSSNTYWSSAIINWLPIDFIDEIRLDCLTWSLGSRVLLNARNNNKNKNRNSEYLNRIKYPSVYKNTVALSMGSCCTCCKRLVKNR